MASKASAERTEALTAKVYESFTALEDLARILQRDGYDDLANDLYKHYEGVFSEELRAHLKEVWVRYSAK